MLTIVFDTLPPDANHAYKHITRRSKSGKTYTGRILTGAAQAWRDGAALTIRSAVQVMDWQPVAPLCIEAWLYHPLMLGFDTDGRVKLLMDAIKDGTGIDDRYYLDHLIRKRRGDERLIVQLSSMDVALIASPKQLRRRTKETTL